MNQKTKTYSGTTVSTVTRRELQHRALARRAAAESFVLLQNDGTLPLPPAKRAAVFGSGALHPVKDGTGSGDVNEREVISIAQGLANAGFPLANAEWLARLRATKRNTKRQKMHGKRAFCTRQLKHRIPLGQ